MRRALLWALLGALWLGAGVPGGPGGVSGCVLCDPAAGAALGELLGPFLARAMPHEPGMRDRLGTLVLRGVLGLARLPRDPQSFMGVIDQSTLDEASLQFRRTLARVMAQDIQDQRIYQEMLWAMREIKEDFEQIMKRFQSQVYCPNKCGRMEVLWIECIFCNLTHFACNRGMDCGERQLWVEEGQDLVLDCALPWHGASHGAKTYSFYRGPASSGGGPEPHRRPPQTRGAAAEEPPRPPPAERLLRSGPDPVLVWKEAAAAAGGRYRCQMRGPGGQVGSELLFNVTVLPRPRVPGQAPPLAPTPPGGLPPAAVAAIVVMIIATVLVAAGIAWFCFRRGDPRDRQDPSQIKES
ncbi:PREDICTED: izumo sperm-egg fusion protein 1 [Pseudopodoces humilis]|uniref:izumo sperm-egg fusion protein 1 n=1 Tax=Pseudopodoces humilis TaxID=181119 RepID=UPI000395C19C|nr:PREDICTED: izumo sperm-egg fusion protein 1 [Pseudopodoces humilis]